MKKDYIKRSIENEKTEEPSVMIPHKLFEQHLGTCPTLLYIEFLFLVSETKSYNIEASYDYFLKRNIGSRMTLCKALKRLQEQSFGGEALITKISGYGKSGVYVVNKDILNDWMFNN